MFAAISILLWAGISRRVTLAVNYTASLHNHLFLVVKNPNSPPKRGDFVYLRFPGHKFFSSQDLFMKIVKGVPGDWLQTKGREIYINGIRVALAKEKSLVGDTLDPLHFSGKIPEGKLFLMGEHLDSYDSRYEDIGLVDASRILGTGYAIL